MILNLTLTLKAVIKTEKYFLRIILVMRIGPSFHGIYIKTLISYRKKFDKNVLVIFTDSTLGYEFLSRGYKCVSFTNNFPIYGQHHNFNRKGLFWSDTSNFKEMTALIDSVKLIKNSDWKKNYKKYSEQILPYDEENRFKKSIIKSFLK